MSNILVNKRERKSKRQPGIDIPETVATLGTQDTRGRQAKHRTQKTKEMRSTDATTIPGVKPGAREGVSSACLL